MFELWKQISTRLSSYQCVGVLGIHAPDFTRSIHTCWFQVCSQFVILFFSMDFSLTVSISKNLKIKKMAFLICAMHHIHSLPLDFRSHSNHLRLNKYRKLNQPTHIDGITTFNPQILDKWNDKTFAENKLKTASKLHLKPLIESIAHLLPTLNVDAWALHPLIISRYSQENNAND